MKNELYREINNKINKLEKNWYNILNKIKSIERHSTTKNNINNISLNDNRNKNTNKTNFLKNSSSSIKYTTQINNSVMNNISSVIKERNNFKELSFIFAKSQNINNDLKRKNKKIEELKSEITKKQKRLDTITTNIKSINIKNKKSKQDLDNYKSLKENNTIYHNIWINLLNHFKEVEKKFNINNINLKIENFYKNEKNLNTFNKESKDLNIVLNKQENYIKELEYTIYMLENN